MSAGADIAGAPSSVEPKVEGNAPLRSLGNNGGNPFSNLKVGMKIGLGSALILVFLASVCTVAYFGLSGANGDFKTYRGLARQTNVMGRIQANLLTGRLNVKDFILKNTDEAADTVRERVQATVALIDRSKELFDTPEEVAAVEQASAEIHEYQKAFEDVTELVHRRNALVDEMNGIGPKAEKDLTKIMESAFEDGDAKASYLAGVTLRHLLLARLYSNRFLVDNEKESAERAIHELTEFDHAAERMRDELQDEKRHETAVEVVELALKYEKTFEKVAEIIYERNRIVTGTLDVLGPKVAGEMEDIKLHNKGLQDELGPKATAAMDTAVETTISVSAVAILLGIVFALLVGRVISRPVVAMTAAMGRLAGGDLAVDIPAVGRADEIGEMAKAVQVFKENAIERERLQAEQSEIERRAAEAEAQREEERRAAAEDKARRETERLEAERTAEQERRAAEERAEQEKRQAVRQLADGFEASVIGVVDTVGTASIQLQSTAQSMTAVAEETARQATTVAAASEEASTNVQTVSAAAEELSNTIAEIGRQVAQSADITGRAVMQAEDTNTSVQGLAEAAQKIGDVVGLISDIAEQTNLLALNATIEAARAGEAGKGFAVVASEVKSLATQTAKATDDIGQQIAGMQGVTGDVVKAIDGIGKTIGEVSEIATRIASAVEQQGAATQEIARNVQNAAAGTQEVNANISGVTQGAAETGEAANQVLDAAGQLSKQSEALRLEVERFLDGVRAA
jgi:methyl-accepting chemotaxis protein